MVKLYYTPTSCGAASFIAAFTGQVNIETELVDIHKHLTASGVDFYSINPKGNVPCLVLDEGTVLNENIAILQFIADMAAPGSIAPPSGTIARAVLQNVLSYIASELHPSFGGLFNPTLGEETKAYLRGNLAKKLAYLEHSLISYKLFLVGDSFTVADSYLYIVLSWTSYLNIDLTPFPIVKRYFERIGKLDNVTGAYARIATCPSTAV